MTNFDFLSVEKNFATFADACIEAEKSIGIIPRSVRSAYGKVRSSR